MGLIPEWQGYLLDALRGTAQYLDLEDRTHEIPEFLKATVSMDRLRNQNSFLVVPELEMLR